MSRSNAGGVIRVICGRSSAAIAGSCSAVDPAIAAFGRNGHILR
jgi:hypothetical protein